MIKLSKPHKQRHDKGTKSDSRVEASDSASHRAADVMTPMYMFDFYFARYILLHELIWAVDPCTRLDVMHHMNNSFGIARTWTRHTD